MRIHYKLVISQHIWKNPPSITLTLWRIVKFALSLSIKYDDSIPKWLNGLLFNSCSDWTRLASTCIRHGELRFLHQWVSATSTLRSFGRLNSPHEYIVCHGKICRLPLVVASWWRVASGALWLVLAFHSLLRVDGEWFLCSLTCARLWLASCSPWQVGFCLFLFVFLLCLVSWVQFLHKWVE